MLNLPKMIREFYLLEEKINVLCNGELKKILPSYLQLDRTARAVKELREETLLVVKDLCTINIDEKLIPIKYIKLY